MRRRAHLSICAIAVVAVGAGLSGCGSSTANPPTTTPPAVPTVLAYVTAIGSGAAQGLGNDLVALNVSAPTTYSTRVATGTFPAAVAVSPSTHIAYVANYASDSVTPVDLWSDRPGRPIPAGSGPAGIAIAPDGKTAYVTDAGSSPIGDTVTPIDLVTDKALAPIRVGAGPEGIAITPDGSTAYVANTGAVVAGQSGAIGDTVTPIDLTTRKALAPITVGNAPEAVAVSIDGTTAYVANANSQSVTPISVATNTAGTPIGVKGSPQALAVTPDGSTVWVADADGKASNLTPVSVSAGTAGTAVTVGAGPTGIAIKGSVIYVVANGANKIDRLALPSGGPIVGGDISVAGGPYAIALASIPTNHVPKALRTGSVPKKKGNQHRT